MWNADRTESKRQRWIADACSLLPPSLLYLWQSKSYGRWLIDDAGITFAYARNLVDGHGLVQQPGMDPVEGYSNPLWLLVMALGKLLHLFDAGTTWFGVPDYVWFPKSMAFACFVGTLACVRHAFRASLGPLLARVAATLAGGLLVVTPAYMLWAVSGLENALYGLLVTGLAALLSNAAAPGKLLTHKVAIAAGLIAFGCSLTRPDGLIYFAAYPCLTLWFWEPRVAPMRRLARVGGAWALSTLLPLGLLFGLRRLIFGAWLPNTALAKAQELPTLDSLQHALDPLAYVGWPFVMVFTALVGVLLGRPDARGGAELRRALVAQLVVLVSALTAFGVLNLDWMPELRFATPCWPLGAGMVAATCVGVLRDVELRLRTRVALPLVLLAGCVLAWSPLRTRYVASTAKPIVPLCLVTDLARIFNHHARTLGLTRGTTVLPDLGGASLVSAFPVVDSAGLTDVTIARAMRDKNTQRVHDYILDRVKPVFLHKHDPWLNDIANDPRFSRDYIALNEGNNYVRRDATLGKEAALARAAAQGGELYRSVHAYYENHPKASCGDRLLPGSLITPGVLPPGLQP